MILTCSFFPIAMKGCTSPRVPTIRITIWSGGMYWRSGASRDSSSAHSVYTSAGPPSKVWGSTSPGTSNSTVPSSFTVAILFNNLSCRTFKGYNTSTKLKTGQPKVNFLSFIITTISHFTLFAHSLVPSDHLSRLRVKISIIM